MTLEEFEAAISDGPTQIAQHAQLKPASVIRARGDARRLRARVAVAAGAGLAVLVAGGAVAGIRYLPNGGRGAAAAPSASVTATGSAAPSASPSVTPGSPLKLALKVPPSYGFAVPNNLSFTITNTGNARTVTVTVQLGNLPITKYGAPPVLYRQLASGRWQAVRTRHGADGWTASYSLAAAAGSTRQHLQLTPAVPNIQGAQAFTGPNGPPQPVLQPFAVMLSAGQTVLAYQKGPTDKALPFTTSLTALPAAGHIREFTITVRNPSAARFPVEFYLTGGACAATGKAPCLRKLPAGDKVQWFDGTAWRNVRAPAPDFPSRTVARWLAGHSAVTLKVRFVAGASGGAGTARLNVNVDSGTVLRIYSGPITALALMSAAFPAG